MKMGLRIGSEMPKLDNINWVSGYPEQQASKPYLVHFWTLDCSSCIELMPDVAALLNRYDGLIHTVSINLEGEDEEEVIAKAKKAGIEAPVGIDEETLLSDAFGYNFIPAFYLFDANGSMRYFQQGQDHVATLEQRIKRLLR